MSLFFNQKESSSPRSAMGGWGYCQPEQGRERHLFVVTFFDAKACLPIDP